MPPFYFGVDYYPEQWPEERWAVDAQLMAEAGFNVVRLAEFAWAKLEPREGKFDFDWLDRAIAILAEREIRIVLGTPTASPPAWLMQPHPELFRVTQDGRRVTFGNRREYCPNQPLYHESTRRIVNALAAHYAAHPAVIGWQIDNEFGERCYCETCAHAFRNWLRARYESLDVLNEKWGTTFWSHTYGDWNEIPLPLSSGGSPNPGLALDYFRFVSDSYIAYQELQLDILREHCPQHFVTHNFMGFKYEGLNYFDLARQLDFVAWDNYPRTQWNMQAEVDPANAALAADTMRGLKQKNFWVMEQQAGSGGWDMVSVTPRPGELRLWAYQSIAHGADGILFFRWRSARYGAEEYWHGLLEHDATPGRRYQEIKRMGGEIQKVGNLLAGSQIKSTVALLYSYEARFAFQVQANNPRFNYADQFQQFYAALYHQRVPIDIIAPDGDLTPYRLVIAPALHIVPDDLAARLERFVYSGGTLVMTPRSGVKDEANAVVNQRLPGILAALSGVYVDEYDSLAPDMQNELEFTATDISSDHFVARIWCDILKPTAATVIARYTQDYYAGQPAITLNSYGTGRVLYIGTIGKDVLYETVVPWLLRQAGIRSILTAPRGVEITERWRDNRRILFVLNHNGHPESVPLDRSYHDLLDSGAILENKLVLAPRSVHILVEQS